MSKRESQTQLVARHTRYQLAKDLLSYITDSKEAPVRRLTRIQFMLTEIIQRDGEGF